MHSWLVKGGLSAKEKEKAATKLFELDVNKSATKKAKTVVIAWADEVLQHYQKSASFCDSVRRGFVRYGQWPDHEGQFISYTHQELAARGRAIANAAAAKTKKAKKRRLSDREVLAKERAEVGVFLAEAAGYYGLDKIKMQQLEEVLTLDEVAAKVIDEATGGGAE